MQNNMEIKLSMTNSEILVRFSNLDDTTFNEVLKMFKDTFPHSRCFRWDSSQKVWRVKRTYGAYLMRFISSTLWDDSNPYQLPLM